MSDFKPMLAAAYDPAKLIYPCFASPKLDGIRASVVDGRLLSRSLKPIPNKHVSSLLSCLVLNGFDGELIAGSPTAPNAMQEATSFFMSHDKVQDFTYFVFDLHNSSERFTERLDALHTQMIRMEHPAEFTIALLPQTLIYNDEQLAVYEAETVGAGYEGVILRRPDAFYKYGRATAKGGELTKVKRFTDSEARIIGFEEQMHNANEATTNELGRTKRSSHQENKHGKGTLGALIVRELMSGIEFNVGTGMNDALRSEVWANRDAYEGRIVKYKSFEVGVKEKPRHPVFLSFRDARDMSA